MTEHSETERVAPSPTSLEAHYKLPRSLCSSASPSDHIWCSRGLVVSPENVTDMKQMCLNSWSPGMVIYAASNSIDEATLTGMIEVLEKTAKQLGRARRITVGVIPSQDMISRLYKCFYCVEHVNSEGLTEILEAAAEEPENEENSTNVVQ